MHVSFAADGLSLEGDLHLPTTPRRAAAVCHPHPQYGGDMRNNVVLALCRAVQEDGWATLRFNFRGVGKSEGTYGNGVGEQSDARAAVRYLQERTALSRVTLAGYSFGAVVALAAGADMPDVDQLIVVAPPLGFFDLRSLAKCTKPKLFIVGARDRFCELSAFRSLYAELAAPKASVEVPEADHFFFGADRAIRDAVAPWLRAPAA
jgi:alpha/beta superfamily hydrolase